LGDGGFFGTVRTGDVDYFNALSGASGMRRKRAQAEREKQRRRWRGIGFSCRWLTWAGTREEKDAKGKKQRVQREQPR
jgi:hypothetical protein